jgi:hypothetical protein
MFDSIKEEFANDSIEAGISSDADPGLRKYVIIFTDTHNDIWCIDPYLKIPNTE